VKARAGDAFVAWVTRHELPVCLALNRFCWRGGVRRFFAAVSRLGDGVLWYCLMGALPLVHGFAGLKAALHMGLAALLGMAIYGTLKRRTGRPRPFVGNRGVKLGAAPLDRFSFPSGHTLHAVGFTAVAVWHFPALAPVLVPFAFLVALSRVVLGLHYPTDVVAGAVLGGLVAWGTTSLAQPFL
jgi:undecaprenyl-diphosphatase